MFCVAFKNLPSSFLCDSMVSLIVLYCTILYYTVLYCTVHILYCTVLYCTILNTVLYCTVLYIYCTILYYTVLYCTYTVLYYTVLYCTIHSYIPVHTCIDTHTQAQIHTYSSTYIHVHIHTYTHKLIYIWYSFRDHFFYNGYVEVKLYSIISLSLFSPLLGDSTHFSQDTSWGWSYTFQTELLWGRSKLSRQY